MTVEDRFGAKAIVLQRVSKTTYSWEARGRKQRPLGLAKHGGRPRRSLTLARSGGVSIHLGSMA